MPLPADHQAAQFESLSDRVSQFRRAGFQESEIADWMRPRSAELGRRGYDPNDVETWISNYDAGLADKSLRAEKTVDPLALLHQVFKLVPRDIYQNMREDGSLSDQDFDKLMYGMAYNLTPQQMDLVYERLVDLHGGFKPSSVTPIARGFWSKMGESVRRGWSDTGTEVAIGDALFKGDKETMETLLSVHRKRRLREAVDPLDGELAARMFYGSANVVSGFSRSMWESTDEAAAGMTAGLIAGAQAGVAFPTVGEEPLTAAGGALIGMGAGFTAGMADFWYRQGTGMMYAEMVDLGYDPHVSGVISSVAALPYALVEFSQVSALAPGAGRVAAKSITGVMARAMKEYGKVWGQEVGEEVVQQAIQIVARDTAAWASNEKGIFVDPDYLSARAWELYNTGKQAGIAMALLPIPQGAVNVISGVMDLPKTPVLDALSQQTVEEPRPVEEPLPETAAPYKKEPGAAETPAPPQVPDFASTIPLRLDATLRSIDEALGETGPEEIPIDATKLTKAEMEVLDALEAEGPVEPAVAPAAEQPPAEEVSPRLHIGNVTGRMKKLWADVFNEARRAQGLPEKPLVKPEDIHEFTDKGFRTNRVGIPMPRTEAVDLERELTGALDDYLLQEGWTQKDVTQMNILWGDIKNLRQVLNQTVGARPFREKHAKGHLVVEIENVKSRIFESIRGLGKKTLARYSWNDLLTEEEALRGAMRQIARAAGKGYRAGMEDARTRYRELKAKQRAVKLEKKRRAQMIKKIAAPVGSGVDFFYDRAIHLLIGGIEPHGRTKKTKARLRSLKDFLSLHPDRLEEIPTKLLLRLAKTPVTEFTSEQLEEILAERQRLEKQGRLKRQLQNAQARRQQQQDVAGLKTAAAQAKPRLVPDDPYAFDTDRVGVIKRISKKLYLLNLRPSRILDMLDGGRGRFKGLWTALFYDSANKAHDREVLNVARRRKGFHQEQERLGIKIRALGERLDVNGIHVPISKLMGIYAAAKNERARATLLHGHHYTNAFIAEAINVLPEKYKALVEWIIGDYAENYPRILEVLIRNTNQSGGARETAYTAMVRIDRQGMPIARSIEEQILQRAGVRRSRVQKGFTESRQDIKPEHQTRIDLDLLSVWESQVRKQEHYIHYAGIIRRMRSLLLDRSLREEVNGRFGKELLPFIDRYVNRLANPSTYEAFTWLAHDSRMLRRNVAYAYLSFNLLTMAKQGPSLVLYTADAGVGHMLSSAFEVATNYREVMQRVRDKDSQVRFAVIQRELEELRRSGSTEYRTLIDRVGITGLTGILFIDGLVRTIGWNAVYQKSIDAGMGEIEAVREAQYATLRTQPASAVKDLAEIYATSEYLNWFTMFTNQLNQLFNIVGYDTFAYWRNGDYRKAAASVMTVAASQMLIWIIAGRKLPEDEDDVKDMASDIFLNLVPILGKYAMAGKRDWETAIAPFEAAKDVGRIFTAQDKERAALRIAEDIAVLSGIPVIAARRTKRFLETAKPIELIGGEPNR